MTGPTLNLFKLVALFIIAATSLSQAQESIASRGKTHRIVFEVTMDGPEQWTAVLNNAENVRTALGSATEMEVVGHSKGLGMLIAKDNALSDRMKKLADAGVVFTACENRDEKEERHEGAACPIREDHGFRRSRARPETGSRLELHQERHMMAGRGPKSSRNYL